jgi:tetratricopeptide (TPR) repeat protein/predicted Ser/Thr protein kinase
VTLPGRRQAERAVVQHALARAYLTPQQVEQARRGLTPGAELLPALRPILSPEHLAELSAVYQRALTLPSPPASPPTVAPPASGAARRGDPAGQRIGPYAVERELGRGGMGVVYLVMHPELGVRRAMKLLLDTSPEHVERFLVEGQAVAKLEHEGIVPVHELGEHQGSPYLVMDFVEGEGLDARLKRDGPLQQREAAELIRQFAEAVAYAHRLGILHRDIKPANVLVGPDGQPRLTDFGLAKQLSDDRERLTRTGQLLGTPAFMPPEQAAGELDAIGFASDVYALGATLYALLTGRPPFDGATAMNVVHSVLNKAPRPPSALRPDLDHDLETVCLQCLHKEPEQRYPSAEALGSDLRRWLEGKPLRARRLTALGRLNLKLRQHTLAVSVVAAGAVLLALGGLGLREYRLGQERLVEARETLYKAAAEEAEAKTAAQLEQVEELRTLSELRRAWFQAELEEKRLSETDRGRAARYWEQAELSLRGRRRLGEEYMPADLEAAARSLSKLERLLAERDAALSIVPLLRARCGLRLRHAGLWYELTQHVPGRVVAERGTEISVSDCRTVLELLEEAERLGSTDPRLHLWRGMALRLLGEPQRALESALRAVELTPEPQEEKLLEGEGEEKAQAHRLVGLAQYCLGSYDQALEALEAAKLIKPQSQPLLRLQAWCYMARSPEVPPGPEGDRVAMELRLATECFADLLVWAPGPNKRTYYLLPRSECYRRLGRLDLARADLDAAVAERSAPPVRAWSLSSRGVFRLEQEQDPAGALDDLNAALTLDGHKADALVARARCLLQLNRREDALRDLRHPALGANPATLAEADALLRQLGAR